MDNKEYVEEQSWDDFFNTGMLWWANRILHMFGWAIVCEMDDHGIRRVYPARVKFRGFSENIERDGFQKVSHYLKHNIDKLEEETKL